MMDEFGKFSLIVKFRDGDTLRSTTLDISYEELLEMVTDGLSDPQGVLCVRVDENKVMLVPTAGIVSVLLIGVG